MTMNTHMLAQPIPIALLMYTVAIFTVAIAVIALVLVKLGPELWTFGYETVQQWLAPEPSNVVSLNERRKR